MDFHTSFLIIPILFFGLMIWSAVWAYGDAEKRGENGLLAAVVVAFVAWPFSLCLWLLIRPDETDAQTVA